MIKTMIEDLQANNSTIAKQSILKDHCVVIGIRDILYYTYNPYFNYGISKKRLEEYGIPEVENRLLSEGETYVLESILTGRLRGNEAVDTVVNYMQQYGGLLGRIISKDLRCGISATTINKVCPKLIPKFNVQLAKEVPKEKWKFPANMQIKYDGVRLLTFISYIANQCIVDFITRNGKSVKLPKLARDFQDAKLPEGIYDGEIVIEEGLLENRTSVSGMINSAMHGGKIDESVLRYYLFDYIYHEEMAGQKSKRTELSRNLELYYIINPNYLHRVRLADTKVVHSVSEVDEFYEFLTSQGYEGVVLKPHTGLYTFKRNPNWIKLKETKTADMIVIGELPGTGKYEDALGKLTVEGIVEGHHIVCNVGSGLSDNYRNKYIGYFTGKTVEVAYNSIIPGKDTGKTLFLPRFKKIRFDKEADV